MTSHQQGESPAVRQLRLVVEAEDFDQALRFYRDVLGLPEQLAYQEPGDARVSILDVGRATLELATPAHRRMVDDLEVGLPTDHRLRVALEVDDAQAVTARLVAAGAELVADARETPWRSLNARLEGPAGLHLTVFQELEDEEQRADLDGFGRAGNRDEDATRG